ncbi:MAG TPA: PKD domain-containing protein, partial [Thermoplasmata archaeon]|nr:PKD domain-containing protein [Thermoplasmata archaeon]
KPITINSNADFTAGNGVRSGTGTASDPYVIDCWTITMPTQMVGITVSNTNAYFIVRNVDVPGNMYTDCVKLNTVKNGILELMNLKSCKTGIWIGQAGSAGMSEGLTLRNNLITQSFDAGINISAAGYGAMSGNQITGGRGVGLKLGQITGNGWSITDNFVGDNSGDAVLAGGGNWGTLAVLHHNTFYNNKGGATPQASGPGPRWDDGGQGNRWSDWTGPDADTNGIVDNPYSITGSAEKDRFPICPGSGCTGQGGLAVTIYGGPTNGPAPLNVSFKAAVSGGTVPYTYAWEFGDGGTGNGQSTTHVYTAAGSFSATCKVTDTGGGSATSNTIQIVVTGGGGQFQVSIAGTPTSGSAPLAVMFSSTPAGGTPPYTYAWEFGDGAIGSTQNPGHTYAAAGVYTATLKVTDSASGVANSNPVTITVTGGGGQLQVSISANPTTGQAPLSVQFTSTPSGGATPYSYAWDFGDSGTATAKDPSHTYVSPGTFTASLKITDSGGGSATSNPVTITVSGGTGQLQVSISATPSSGAAPLAVVFSSTPAGGTAPYTYAWEFGDGGTSADKDPAHTYASAGTFTAVMKLTDSQGGSATSNSVGITVTASQIPAVTATFPQDAATGVAMNTDIGVTFSIPMDTAATESAFAVSPSASGAFRWSSGDTVVALDPASDLTASTKYTVTLGTGAKSKQGVALGAPHSFSFTTGSGQSPIPPKVAGTVPSNGATNVARNANIVIAFDQEMDLAATKSAISAAPTIGGAFTWNSAGDEVTWDPSADLVAGTEYTVVVGAGAKSKSGVGMSGDYRFSFKTGTTLDNAPAKIVHTPVAQASEGDAVG